MHLSGPANRLYAYTHACVGAVLLLSGAFKGFAKVQKAQAGQVLPDALGITLIFFCVRRGSQAGPGVGLRMIM